MHHKLDEQKATTRQKIAALWTSFMFLYIYVDYFHLYMPHKIQDIIAGKVFTFDITQRFVVAALVSVSIPAIMIALSLMLPAKIARWTNIIIATLFIPYTLFNLAGEFWAHMVLAAVVEVLLLCFVIHYAWNWPKAKNER